MFKAHFSFLNKGCFTILLLLITSTIMTDNIVKGDNQVTTSSREELLLEFIQDCSTSQGFKATPKSPEIALDSTYYGVFLSDALNSDYDIYSIILGIQSLQNTDGGFALTQNENSSIFATYYGLQTLTQLGLNAQLLGNWNVSSYLNETITPLLYSTNFTNLKPTELRQIEQFLVSISLLNITVIFSFQSLIENVKNIQYSNGSYPSFSYAIHSVLLLSLFNQKPTDRIGAINYIKAFRYDDTGFEANLLSSFTLEDTYLAVLALNSLGSTVEYRTKLIDAILDCQTMSGGFANTTAKIQPTLENTYYAFMTLFLLDSLDILNQLAFLSSTGFLSYPLVFMFIGIILLSLYHFKINKKQNR